MIRVCFVLVLFILGSFSGASHASAQGATTDAGEPVISRMCLWNADQGTWKTLNVKRRQIRLLNELKLKYPAVVGGQWDVESEGGDAVMPQVGSERHTTGAPTDPYPAQPALASDQNANAASKPALSRLQADLRAVLTTKQLRAWAELCGGRYSMLPELRKMP
ncbi:MAG: hypothetical protein IPM46_14285 [Flavobacteriales bacterium]|nr:hypothetical protein [Flavobacteriales bacterium]